MGMIPAVAFDAAATYAADVFTAPLPVAFATLLAVLSVIGLRILEDRRGAARPDDGRALWLLRRLPERSSRRVVAVALLPRLPQRVPQTRTPRPALPPDVAAYGLLRGPPGCISRLRQTGAGLGILPG